MELENLKQSWAELNDRLDRTDEQLRELTDRATRRHADDLRRRTERRLWLPIAAAGLLPLLMYNLSRMDDLKLSPFCLAALCVFVAAAVANNIALLVRLRDIDPIHSTVSEICRRTRRLRRHLLRGLAMQMVLMFVLVLSIVLCITGSGIDGIEPLMYGFWGGVAIGLPAGIYRFMQIYGDIAEMEHSFGMDGGRTEE